MKNPNPTKQAQTQPNQSPRLLLLSRTGIALGVPVLVGLGGGALWLWNFVQTDLAPLVQKNLTQTLQRPVQLGRVEGFSLTGMRFGASSVPATPTDPDRAAVTAVDVAFNPLHLLFTRTLKLGITFVDPDVYIEQNREGEWIAALPQVEQKPGLIKTELDTIRFNNADVVLVPNPRTDNTKKPFAIAQVNGTGQLLDQNQLIKFELNGQPVAGGSLRLQGESNLKTQQIDLQLQVQNFLASDVTRLVVLPLDLRAGRVDSNLTVQLRPDLQQPTLSGTASLQSVTAKFDQLPQSFINTQGTLNFQGTQIRLNNVQTNYGKIPAIANGSLDTLGNFDLSARVNSATLANAQETLSIKSPVSVSGLFQADLRVTGPATKPILSGKFATIKPVRVDRVTFSTISSQFGFSTATSEVTLKDIQAIPAAGGKITGGGTIGVLKPKLALNAVASNVPGDAIARLYGVSPQIQIGTVVARAQVSGTPTNPRTAVNWQAPGATYPASGEIIIESGANSLLLRNAVLNVAGGTVRASGQLADGRLQASVQADDIQPGRLAEVPPGLQAPLNGTLNLSGTTGSFQPETISLQGSGRVNVAGGVVTAANIQIADGQWQALGRAEGVQIGRIVPLPPQSQGTLRDGRFNLSGSLTAFSVDTIRGNAQGRVNIGGGTVRATNIQLAEGQWQVLGNADGIQLGRIVPQIPPQLGGTLRDGRFDLSGSLTAFNVETIRGSAQGQLNVAGGTVRATNIQLAGGQWQALGSADGIQLGQIVPQSQQLQGTLRNGKFNLSGRMAATAPENIQGNVSGQLRVASGTVTATNVQLASGDWQGSFVANGVELGTLAKLAPSSQSAQIEGRLSGNIVASGPLSGFNLAEIQASGQLRLLDLAANGLDFDPVLSGPVNVIPGQGVNLQLAGVQDRIELALSPTYRPISFLVQRDRAIATGSTQGDLLTVKANNFPISVLKAVAPAPPAIAAQPVAGELSGDLAINLNTFAAEGDVAIAQPAIGTIKFDQLSAQFRYANGGTRANAELTQGESRYALTGSFTQTPRGPEFQARANITQGKIQNILAALQLYELEDFGRGAQIPTYARAADVSTVAVGLPEAPLLTQLRRFSEIEVLLEQQQRRDASPLPSLADFQGTFGGEISLSGSFQGVEANFDLQGNNWTWGPYTANQVIAQGNFENGVLTLVPLRLVGNLGSANGQSETLLAFSGQVGGTQQSGQLRVRDFPVDVLKNFVQLPVDFTGLLNATATLAGSQANPQAIGELNLAQGTLNQKPVESARATFNYTQARLNFASNVVVSGPEPITITGSLPYSLPSASVQPDSDQIRLDVNVQNEGLALLNLLTNQVAWQGGQGKVQLQVRGTLKQPVATGIASINNATIKAQALPEPLKDVTGTAQFNGNRIQVEGIRGNFSQGNVVAQGVIPLFGSLAPSDPDRANPLTVDLNQLDLTLEGLYRGGASGNVVITGSALNPIVGGEVQLAQGDVLLEQREAATVATTTDSGATSSSSGGISAVGSGATSSGTGATSAAGSGIPEFNNLQIILGDNIDITRAPVINIRATGTLTLNGRLDDLRPEGTIRLRRGGVNLFTTQFTQAQGTGNIAKCSLKVA